VKKVFFYTLGCKLNFAETSHISKLLVDNGFSVAHRGEAADVCIVNTCSVTDTADRKCRQAIHKIVSDNPNAFIIVTGCYAQVNPSEIEQIDGVDLVLGAKEKFDILKVMHLLESKEQFERIQVNDIKSNNSFTPIFSAGDRTRYFLKVQDGCDYYCTYCTIPFARGKSRSASVAHTMQTIDRALEQGAKEIILTGVNIGDFGRGSNERFIDLVKAIDKLNAEVRVRISSVEPNLLEDAIIDIVASSKIIAPHFHIPLQSGSNRVLSLMGRRYTREVFGQKVSLIKRLIPDAFIGVDVIVGMRGETPDMFDETLSLLGDTPFSELHIFPYSEREGTKALSIKPIVSQSEKKRRSELLHNLSDSRIADFYRSQRGKTKTVLWETTKNPKAMNGYTENYLLVSAEMEQEKINTFQKIVF
jgi:MiaB-like protein